jgi:transcriptional regulator with XRE-family HTH domain
MTTMSSERAEEPTTPDNQHGGPGRVLAAQREAMGWTVEQVADQLKLAVRQVVALEAGDYAALPSPAVTRGFVRAYAKLVKSRSGAAGGADRHRHAAEADHEHHRGAPPGPGLVLASEIPDARQALAAAGLDRRRRGGGGRRRGLAFRPDPVRTAWRGNGDGAGCAARRVA